METEQINENELSVTIEQRYELTVRVELPAFRKTPAGTYFKVISRENIIMVESWSSETAIRRGTYFSGSAFSNTEKCTEEEFNEMFNKCLKLLTND